MSLPPSLQTRTGLLAFLKKYFALKGSTGGGSGAPTTAQYVTLATDGDLSAERVLTQGTGISIVDGGAGSTVTISATGGGGTPAGSTTEVQYNNAGSFGASSDFTWDGSAILTRGVKATNLRASAALTASVIHVNTKVHYEQSTAQTSSFTVGTSGVYHPVYQIDTTSGAVTASLPQVTGVGGLHGLTIVIKDYALSASTNNIVVSPSGSDTIDLGTSLKIQTNGGAVTMIADSSAGRWYILSAAN